MAVRVTSSGTTQVKDGISSRGKTRVKRVTVGKPVRRISEQRLSIDRIEGIDISNSTDGSILVYNGSSNNYEATVELEVQIINGGQY